MKKTILTLTIMTLLLGCSKNSDDENQFSLGAVIELGIRNSAGVDLLNPNNQESFNESDIKLFYLINGNVEEVNNPTADLPRNFQIFEQNGSYRIGISLNYSESEELPITYVQWNETDTDTLKCKIRRTSSLVTAEKVWLNDELIWDESSNNEPYFEIIKE